VKRPAHMISSPVSLDTVHPDIQAMFKGMALYNDGLITVAYREPVIFRNIRVGGYSLFYQPIAHALAPDTRIEIEIQGAWDDMRTPTTPLRKG